MLFLFLEEREDKTRDHNSTASTPCYKVLLSVETSGCCYYHQLASPPGIFHLPHPLTFLPLSLPPSLSLSLSLSTLHPFSSLFSSPLYSQFLFSSFSSKQPNPVSCSLSFVLPRRSDSAQKQPNLNPFSAPAARETFFSPTWNRLNHNIPIS